MVVYNAASKELTAKIVYYGPGFGGKTTNLQFLHRRLEPSSVGNLLTLAATADRTIFFDLLPVELGDLKGYRIRFQVATVPGQSPYNETRRVVLRGADGIVFVVDSRWSQLPKNLESLQNLRDNLKEEGIDPAVIPFTVQFNKRDLPDVLAIDALQEGLGLAGFPFIEATASEGKGVVETFKLISKLTFVDILRRLQKKGAPKPARPATVETENLAAWKTSILHGKSALHEEPAVVPPPPRPGRVPEPLAFPEPDDMSATRAIPISKPRPVPSPAATPSAAQVLSDAESQPIAVPPFPVEEPAKTAPPPATSASRATGPSDVVFETFAPFPEVPGVTEDTNPAFYDHPPSGVEGAAVAAADRASTASFPAVTENPPEGPTEIEITTPMSLGTLLPGPERVTESAPEPAHDSHLEERMIHLAIASTWGDRISAGETRLARIEEKIAGSPESGAIESRLAALEGAGEAVRALEARLARAEGARGWEKDVNVLRTEAANSRMGMAERISDLQQGVAEVRQNLAEASGREMELVAQVSRESLGIAASIERLDFRIRDTEEKFSQLVVDQESRLSRLERLVDEQSSRTIAERESQRRAIAELAEELPKLRAEIQTLREEGEERHRLAAAGLEETLRADRDDRERARGEGRDLRGVLADSLAEIIARLRGNDPAS